MLYRDYTHDEIAHALGRAQGVISTEISSHSTRKIYDPKKAHHKAQVKRKNASFRGGKIVRDKKLRAFIEEALLEMQSPRAISGRLRCVRKDLIYVAKNVIHDFLGSSYGSAIAWKRRLPKSKKRHTKKGKLSDRKFIEKRPRIVEKRGRVGDCEGDFIVSGRSGKGHLLVVVDRKTRISFLEIIHDVSVDNVHKAFLRIQKRFPEMKTLTLDNDILFKMHKTLETLLGIPIYFCHPYHSWEKGSVENVNKYIRKYIPKGDNISQYSIEDISLIEKRCNGRFMEALQFRTPAERLKESRLRSKKNESVVVERKEMIICLGVGGREKKLK